MIPCNQNFKNHLKGRNFIKKKKRKKNINE